MISLHTSFLRIVRERFVPKNTPFVYVAMGDSAAEGIGASSLMRSYPGVIYNFLKRNNKHVVFHNLGKRKSPASWIIKEQLEKAIELSPHLITISVGANDMRVKNLPWRFESELRFLIKELKAKTQATIVINSIPDFSHVYFIPSIFRPVAKVVIKKFNAVIEKAAKEEGIVYVDLFQQTGIFAKNYPEATAEDRFHPSDFGYALWANSIIHTLSTSNLLSLVK